MGANLWPADAVTGAPSYTGRVLRQTLGGAWTKLSSASARRPVRYPPRHPCGDGHRDVDDVDGATTHRHPRP